MNEENKNITPEEGVPSAPEETAAEEVFQTRIPRSKRTALIRYMAVLFAAAFVLVLVSLVLQMRTSDMTINKLHQSSASALAKAESLQEENRKLQAQLAESNRYIGLAREEGEKKQEDTATAYDALIRVITSKPSDGDVDYSKAVETVENMREYLSPEALALFDEVMDARAENGNKER